MLDDKSRVLVVEDNNSWQELYKEIIEDKECSVTSVTSLTEAIESLNQCYYHAAIVDLRLSENPQNLDGMEILKHIASLGEGTESVVMSGFTDINMFDEFKSYGVTVMEKPEDKSTLDISVFKKKVKEKYTRARQIHGRRIWLSSPFSFMKNKLARDVQLEIGGGQMSELRVFLGKLCLPFSPWLQAIIDPIPIMVDEKCIGYSTPCWSRSTGSAILIKFARADLYKEKKDQPMPEVLQTFGNLGSKLQDIFPQNGHFTGAVYKLEGVEFSKFKPPVLRKVFIQ